MINQVYQEVILDKRKRPLQDFESDEYEKVKQSLKSLSPKERRKVRNKYLARKSRQRFKDEMQNLKESLIYLVKENQFLKNRLETLSNVRSISFMESSENNINSLSSLMDLIKSICSTYEYNLHCKDQDSTAFCISNAISSDFPIIYASDGFYDLTGYSKMEILGKNPRFLQGPGSDKNKIKEMRDALQNGKDTTVTILNYKKNGNPFLNQVQLVHLKDCSGKTFFVVGMYKQIIHSPCLENLKRTESMEVLYDLIKDISQANNNEKCSISSRDLTPNIKPNIVSYDRSLFEFSSNFKEDSYHEPILNGYVTNNNSPIGLKLSPMQSKPSTPKQFHSVPTADSMNDMLISKFQLASFQIEDILTFNEDFC